MISRYAEISFLSASKNLQKVNNAVLLSRATMGNDIGIHFRGYPHVSLEVELTTMADAVKHKEKFNLFFFYFQVSVISLLYQKTESK